jgi:hypothetical protein
MRQQKLYSQQNTKQLFPAGPVHKFCFIRQP